jgi:menaquinone-dependent protoporphyrinogen oxidase
MKVLVTYGSKRGGTEGLAQMVAKALRGSGHEAEVRRAEEIDGLEAWDAVVVGGALYAARWHRAARRFVQRHVDELREMPVWFFSSGPLDDSATQGEIAPTRQVSRLMEQVNARGHVTFGGRLEANAQGFVAQAMAKNGRVGDWRDEEDVSAWAHGVASELSTMTPRQAAAPVGSARARRATRQLVEGVLSAGVRERPWRHPVPSSALLIGPGDTRWSDEL